MESIYPLRVQAIRSRGQNPRLYVSFPLALAAIIAGIGGQTGLNITSELAENGVLEKFNVEVLGTSVKSIREAEHRD